MSTGQSVKLPNNYKKIQIAPLRGASGIEIAITDVLGNLLMSLKTVQIPLILFGYFFFQSQAHVELSSIAVVVVV